MKYVLVTEGKHESVDYATIHVVPDYDVAKVCNTINEGRDSKYWSKAEIVEVNQRVELIPPSLE